VKKPKYCFAINSYNQALEIIEVCIKEKIIPILYIKYFLINGYGVDWLVQLNVLILKKYKSKDFSIFVDTKDNYGLFISLVEKKIKYLKTSTDNKTITRLKQIGKINKVLINPNFSIIDLSNIKKISIKIKKILQE
tara:strand:+ start:883 stop:1290 length:408 start_codon:yes stop_codon:yes gene_type:complete